MSVLMTSTHSSCAAAKTEIDAATQVNQCIANSSMRSKMDDINRCILAVFPNFKLPDLQTSLDVAGVKLSRRMGPQGDFT